MVPGIYNFPTAVELSEIASERARVLEAESALSEFMPMNTKDGYLVEWEYRENVSGLSPLVQNDATYGVTRGTGSKVFGMNPSHFGETRQMGVTEMLNIRNLGTYAHEEAAAWLERNMTEILIRQRNTMEAMRSQIMVNAAVSMLDKAGNLTTVSQWDRPSSGTLVLTGNDRWNQASTGIVLQPFRTIRDTKRGLGFDFGRKAKAVANSKTWALAWTNTNSADLGGERGMYGQTIRNLSGLGEAMVMRDNLPTPVACDDSYIDGDGVVQMLIPDNYVLVVGYHATNGLRLGNIEIKSHPSLMGRAGIYANTGMTHVEPPIPYVSLGALFGPRIDYLNQLVLLQVV